MKIVSLIVCILILSQHALAIVCPSTPDYNATITTLCTEKDIDVLWPNYENVNQYYRCQGAGHAILETCLLNTIFDFSRQMCTNCDDYIPAPPCQSLKGKTCKTFKPLSYPVESTTTAPTCNVFAIYTTSFKPACVGVDLYMLWPNYKNVSKYYKCQGAYNPIIETCPGGTFFNYYEQSCADCLKYVAAPACEKLPFNKTNKCLKL